MKVTMLAWRLPRLPGGGTGLITRMHTLYEWHRPLTPLTVLLTQVADFAMMRWRLFGSGTGPRPSTGAEQRKLAKHSLQIPAEELPPRVSGCAAQQTAIS